MEKGTVYFFTGLSGSGKTTLGGLFYQRLKTIKPNVVLLDGDRTRPIFCEDAGYTMEDRLRGSRRTFRICKMLADQGIDVVGCYMCMHDEIREWNRENIENYVEIYVKVSRETLFRRDQKGLYTSGAKNVIGVDLPFEEPKFPDIILENDGQEAPEVIIDRLEAQLDFTQGGGK